jgi:hypothetical protein
MAACLGANRATGATAAVERVSPPLFTTSPSHNTSMPSSPNLASPKHRLVRVELVRSAVAGATNTQGTPDTQQRNVTRLKVGAQQLRTAPRDSPNARAPATPIALPDAENSSRVVFEPRRAANASAWLGPDKNPPTTQHTLNLRSNKRKCEPPRQSRLERASPTSQTIISIAWQ